MSHKVRWGIIGLGHIANNFAKDLQLVANAELVAVASRSIEKAKDFGTTYHAKHTFGSYEALFNCDEVDVIYIATPHTSHADLSIQAMQCGKNILCEKPAGINRAEVEKMISVAKENKVFLMEALWSRFNPTIRKVKKMVDDGEIGKIGYLHANFAFYAMDRGETHRLLDPELGGGTILDIGIYPIFLAYLMLGKPDEIIATSNFSNIGTEIQTSMIFKYADAQAILYSGFTSNSEMKAEVSGSKGTIHIHPKWHEAKGYSMINENIEESFEVPKLGRGYAHEVQEVQLCLKEGKLESDLWSHQNSIDLVSLMDQVREKSGVVFPFEG